MKKCGKISIYMAFSVLTLSLACCYASVCVGALPSDPKMQKMQKMLVFSIKKCGNTKTWMTVTGFAYFSAFFAWNTNVFCIFCILVPPGRPSNTLRSLWEEPEMQKMQKMSVFSIEKCRKIRKWMTVTGLAHFSACFAWNTNVFCIFCILGPPGRAPQHIGESVGGAAETSENEW